MRKDKNTYRILVAEDNPGDFFLVEEYLDETILAPEITHVESYFEIEQQLKHGKNNFDIILLDLTLNDKKGEELINDVLKISKSIPTIILTGYTDVNFATKSLAMGASDYLIKDDLNATTLHKSIVYTIERNKTLAKIKESEQRYADLFHLSPQPMWVYSLDTLRFLDVNDSAIKHYGYTEEEFLSMTIKDIRPKEEVPKLEQVLKKSYNKERFFFQGVYKHQKKNNEIIDVDIRSNIIDYNGQKAELILVNDITERVFYTNAIVEQNKKLREIAWLQSHAVRAPLTRIIGLVQAIKDGDLDENEKKQYFSHILESSDELDTIIKDVVNKSQQIEIKDPPNEPTNQP